MLAMRQSTGDRTRQNRGLRVRRSLVFACALVFALTHCLYCSYSFACRGSSVLAISVRVNHMCSDIERLIGSITQSSVWCGRYKKKSCSTNLRRRSARCAVCVLCNDCYDHLFILTYFCEFRLPCRLVNTLFFSFCLRAVSALLQLFASKHRPKNGCNPPTTTNTSGIVASLGRRHCCASVLSDGEGNRKFSERVKWSRAA